MIHKGYRRGPNEGRISMKVGTPQNIMLLACSSSFSYVGDTHLKPRKVESISWPYTNFDTDHSSESLEVLLVSMK